MFSEKNLVFRDDRIFYEREGKVLAEIDFEDIGENRMNIGHVYVDESLRGNGVGNVLVEKAVKFIKDKGYVVQATCPFARKYLQENNCE